MELSPFPHQGPLDPWQLPSEAAFIDDLVQRVSERRVTALLGPRRYGKTTALRAVVERLRDAAVPIWLDLYALASWADLADRLDRALADIASVGTPSVSELSARFDLPLGMLSVELRKPPAQRPDPMLLVQSQLDVLVRAAQSQPIVLVIDEFSGIVGVDGAAARLRTTLQHHFQEIGLLFAGSEPSTMQMLFTDRAEPFYSQADLVEVLPFDLATVDRIVRTGFASTGRDAGSVPALIVHKTHGHPQRTMELADAVWSAVRPGTTATDADLFDAFDRIVTAAASGFERLFASFESGERLVLRALANGEPLFGSYANSLGLSNGGAQHARDALVGRGHLRRLDALTIVDPLLAEWLRRRF